MKYTYEFAEEDTLKPITGDTIDVHFSSYHSDGKRYDTTKNWGTTRQFTLGDEESDLTPCWEKGVPTMQIGDKALFVCEPVEAFGEKGSGDGRVSASRGVVINVVVCMYKCVVAFARMHAMKPTLRCR